MTAFVVSIVLVAMIGAINAAQIGLEHGLIYRERTISKRPVLLV